YRKRRDRLELGVGDRGCGRRRWSEGRYDGHIGERQRRVGVPPDGGGVSRQDRGVEPHPHGAIGGYASRVLRKRGGLRGVLPGKITDQRERPTIESQCSPSSSRRAAVVHPGEASLARQ